MLGLTLLPALALLGFAGLIGSDSDDDDDDTVEGEFREV